jgi:hypothetical protein
MSWPTSGIDPVLTIRGTDTLRVAQHTALHTDALQRIERIQSFIGIPVTGEKTGTLRQRITALENIANPPAPILNFVARSVPIGTAPTVNWDAATGTVELGIPAGSPGVPGAPGTPGTPFTSGTLAVQDFPPGTTLITQGFAANTYTGPPRVLCTPVQQQSGPSMTPLAVGVRDVTNVGFNVVVTNLEAVKVRAAINWIAL